MYNIKYLLAPILLILFDMMYLNVTKSYMYYQIKKVQNEDCKINVISMFICYIFIFYLFNYFVVKHHLSSSDSFLLGLLVYGIYETTNKAIFTNWSWITVFIDTLWGGLLFYFTSLVIHLF